MRLRTADFTVEILKLFEQRMRSKVCLRKGTLTTVLRMTAAGTAAGREACGGPVPGLDSRCGGKDRGAFVEEKCPRLGNRVHTTPRFQSR